MAASPRPSGDKTPSPARASGKGGTAESVKVAVRVRPFNEREKASSQVPVLTMSTVNAQVQIRGSKDAAAGMQTFAFDYVFWSMDGPYAKDKDGKPPSTQQDVYAVLGRPLVDQSFSGYNGCLFAYGQTGSGKTHTMLGGAPGDLEQTGVIPRICADIFADKAALEGKAGARSTYAVEVGYVEVYNENVNDLLAERKADSRGRPVEADVNLTIVTAPGGGVLLQNQTMKLCDSPEMMLGFIEQGNGSRHVAATKMNARSSRSHAIFQIMLRETRTTVMASGQTVTGAGMSSRLNLVDLAGSERTADSGVQGKNFDQAVNINLSLSVLGRCIDALAKLSKNPKTLDRPPYRESKLTRILQDSLGGNCKTFMVAAVSPSDMNLEESIATLRYASRAREIVNTAKVNEDPQARRLRELEEEVQKLQSAANAGDPEYVSQMQQQLELLQKESERHVAEMAALAIEKQQMENHKKLLHATAEEKAKLQTERDDLAQQMASTREMQQRQSEEMAAIKKEHEQREHALKQELADRENAMQDMQQQLKGYEQGKQELARTMAELSSERETKAKALEDLEARQRELSSLMSGKEQSDAERVKLAEENAQLAAKHEQAAKEAALAGRAEADAKRLRETVDGLRTGVLRLESQAVMDGESIGRFDVEADMLWAALADQRHYFVRQLRLGRFHATAQLNEVEEKLAAVEQAKDELDTDLSVKATMLAERDGQLEDVELELATAQNRVKALTAESLGFDDKVDDLEAANKKLEARVAELSNSESELKAELAKLGAGLDAQRAAAETAGAEASRLTAALAAKTAEHDALDEKLTSTAGDLGKEVEGLKAELADAQAALAAKTAELAAKTAALAAKTAEHAAVTTTRVVLNALLLSVICVGTLVRRFVHIVGQPQAAPSS